MEAVCGFLVSYVVGTLLCLRHQNSNEDMFGPSEEDMFDDGEDDVFDPSEEEQLGPHKVMLDIFSPFDSNREEQLGPYRENAYASYDVVEKENSKEEFFNMIEHLNWKFWANAGFCYFRCGDFRLFEDTIFFKSNSFNINKKVYNDLKMGIINGDWIFEQDEKHKYCFRNDDVKIVSDCVLDCEGHIIDVLNDGDFYRLNKKLKKIYKEQIKNNDYKQMINYIRENNDTLFKR